MNEEERLLRNRYVELARRAAARACYAYTEFLTLAEQDMLAATGFAPDCAPWQLYGGYAGAERKLACFGSERLCGFAAEPPISCLAVRPANTRFSDQLTHRDFLGALLHLGVRRAVLGDIVVEDNRAYLFVLSGVADFIREQLTQVKHTAVSCAAGSVPPPLLTPPPPATVNVASARLDALLAAVYKLSRQESRELIASGRVSVRGRQVTVADFPPRCGDMVSVRGQGRFLYEGIVGETRKSRLRAQVRIYR